MMNINRIEFFTKQHPFDPSAMTLRGEYILTQEITLTPSELQEKYQAKQLICDSIERQAIFDAIGVTFARKLDDEVRFILVDALVRANMDWTFTKEDGDKRSTKYRNYKLREELIYELRSGKL